MPVEQRLFYPRHMAPAGTLPEGIFMDERGLMPMPAIVAGLISEKPQRKQLITEMLATNPTTALHQTMVAETYLEMCGMYLDRIRTNTSPGELDQLGHFLLGMTFPVFMHDTGKWGILPGVADSVNVINSQPPEAMRNGNGFTDHRTSEETRLHEMHAVAGSFMSLTLGKIELISPSETDWLRFTSLMHHAHFNNSRIAQSDGKGDLISYPIPRIIYDHPNVGLYCLMVIMADTVSAMGQPRIYRDSGRTDHHIIRSLETILDDYLDSLNYAWESGEKNAVRGSFIAIAFQAMRNIQTKYPEEVCRAVKGFVDDDGTEISASSYGSDQLATLTGQTWKSFGRELLRASRAG